MLIFSDSMIKNFTVTSISRDHTSNIRPHPVVTSDDMWDYLKPDLSHHSDFIFLHYSINDIRNEINTLKEVKKLLKEVKEKGKQMS